MAVRVASPTDFRFDSGPVGLGDPLSDRNRMYRLDAGDTVVGAREVPVGLTLFSCVRIVRGPSAPLGR